MTNLVPDIFHAEIFEQDLGIARSSASAKRFPGNAGKQSTYITPQKSPSSSLPCELFEVYFFEQELGMDFVEIDGLVSCDYDVNDEKKVRRVVVSTVAVYSEASHKGLS